MIETFYSADRLGTPAAFFVALVLGLAFGFALERAGFGSSRKLAGIFYFRDMTVLKVMFTAVITAMLGLFILVGLGAVDLGDDVYLMPTIYGAQVVGGLLFGLGFVMGGWCPGTAAVGAAGGKLDAVVFLLGAGLGSIGFNETFSLVEPLYQWGAQAEPLFAFGLSPTAFAFLFTLVAIGAFYFAEWVEKRTTGRSQYLGSPFLKAFSLALVVFALALFIFPGASGTSVAEGPGATAAVVPTSVAGGEQAFLAAVESGEDHVEPEDLANRLIRGEPDLLVVDVRPPGEYEAFHIRGAVNVALAELPEYLVSWQNRGTIVLYSTGMTHPAQARDTLARMGYGNVYILTDGLQGFVDRCLKPVSLRDGPLSPRQAEQVRAWRAHFLGGDSGGSREDAVAIDAPGPLPGLISTEWLTENLGRPGLKVIDLRSGPEYTTSHIPGSLRMDPESVRGTVGGVQSMLLPAEVIVSHLSLLGIQPNDLVVLAPGEKFRDATLVGMALSRVGHARWGILQGGFDRWASEALPLDAALVTVEPTAYPLPSSPDGFTADYQAVRSRLGDGRTVILDSRPADYFTGEKSDEARPGHIPGGINRPYGDDLDESGNLKPLADLEAAYAELIPSKDTPVIVHCRTGHQASQTYFVLANLLGYRNVRWYDGGWSEWAARPELPATN